MTGQVDSVTKMQSCIKIQNYLKKTRVLKVKDVKFIKFNKTMRKIVITDNGFIFRFDNQSRYEKTLDIGNKLFWNV